MHKKIGCNEDIGCCKFISAVKAEDITLTPLKTYHHSLDIVTTESN